MEPEAKPVERRRQPDLLVRWVRFAGGVVWLFLVPLMLVYGRARPESRTFFTRWLGADVRTYWDVNLMHWVFYLMLMMLVLCATTLAVNSVRHHRKSDHFSPSIVIMTGVSVVGIIAYLAFFKGAAGFALD